MLCIVFSLQVEDILEHRDTVQVSEQKRELVFIEMLLDEDIYLISLCKILTPLNQQWRFAQVGSTPPPMLFRLEGLY